MQTKPPTCHGRCRDGGFNRVDLCAVIVVVFLLTVVVLPALGRTTQRSTVAQCASNLKQYILALQIYGAENQDNLPSDNSAFWAWDTPVSLLNFVQNTGVHWSSLYCPGTSGRFTEQDNLNLLHFGGATGVIGYASTFQGNPEFASQPSSFYSTNVNTSLNQQKVPIGSGIMGYLSVHPSARVLAADATLCMNAPSTSLPLRQTFNYTNIPGGFNKPHLSAHLNGSLPAGGNLGMVDGHVEWRGFYDPRFTARAYAAGSPAFWW